MFQDYLVYATDVETRYAFRVVHLSHLVQEAARRHKLAGKPALLLADILTSGVLLSSILETEERVNLRIQCGSEFTLASETTCHGQTRGYFEAAPDSKVVSQLTAGERTNESVIVRSIRSLPGTGRLNEGVTRSFFDSVEKVVNEHIEQSFQAKARMKLESWFDSAGTLRSFGVIYLELPGLDPAVEEKLGEHVGSLGAFSDFGQSLDDPDLLVQALIPDLVRPVNSITPSWQCTCSLASVESMLLTLPVVELLQMSESAEPTVISCHYCSTDYSIAPDRMKDLSLSKAAEKSAQNIEN